MAQVACPRILISGIGPGVGKSLISIGLVHELRKRSISVSCCVVGPNLVQASILKRLTGRYVRCLDGCILSSSQNLNSLSQAASGADIVVIEGNAGLFDGYSAGTLRGSDAEIAGISRSPVILVADVSNFGNSLIALIKGYAAFAKNFTVAGSILNRTATKNGIDDEGRPDLHDREFFEVAMQAFGMPKLIGALPVLPFECDVPRYCLSERKNLSAISRQFFYRVGEVVNQCIDVSAILSQASTPRPVESGESMELPNRRRTRIAIADDSCFNLCFQDNLDLLRHFGAELVSFSPLADAKLPPRIGAVYLTGAYLSEYAEILAQNQSLRNSIQEFVQQGGVLYAESGGAAFLCDQYEFPEDDRSYPGVGVLPGIATFKPGRFSYQEVVSVDDSIFGDSGVIAKGVSTGEWEYSEGRKIVRVFRCSVDGRRTHQEGYSPSAQSVATFSFLHFASNPQLARSIVEAAEVVSGSSESP